MALVWNLARGVLWVAGAATRLSLNTIVLSASAALTVVRVYKVVEQLTEVVHVIDVALTASRGSSLRKKNK